MQAEISPCLFQENYNLKGFSSDHGCQDLQVEWRVLIWVSVSAFSSNNSVTLSNLFWVILLFPFSCLWRQRLDFRSSEPVSVFQPTPWLSQASGCGCSYTFVKLPITVYIPRQSRCSRLSLSKCHPFLSRFSVDNIFSSYNMNISRTTDMKFCENLECLAWDDFQMLTRRVG